MNDDNFMFQPPDMMRQPQKPQKPEFGVNAGDLSEQINNVNRRLRVLEERYSTMNKKYQMTDQNMIRNHRELSEELKAANLELMETKRAMQEMKDRMLMIVKELQGCAKKEEVEVLRKYINLWEPVHFVTQNEVGKIIKEELEHLQEKE